MNETTRLLAESAERMFADSCTKSALDAAEQGAYPEDIHALIVDNGLHLAGDASLDFGSGDLFELLKVAGRHALPVPLAEMLLSRRWLSEDGVAIGLAGPQSDAAVMVPWGRRAQKVLVVAGPDGGCMLAQVTSAETSVNMAGEARDRLSITDAQPVDLSENPYQMLALSRVALMSGTLDRVLDLGVGYALEREQFGRSISKFQAIQHSLAIVAGEVAASKRAADAAIDALGEDEFVAELAAAKARIGEAVGVVAEAVHQVHGAMGYTHEHTLHHFTRRLWAWRDEFGNEVYWQRVLGRRIAALGADQVWDFIAS